MEDLEPKDLRTRIRQAQKLSAEVAKEERQLRQAISEKRARRQDVKWNMNHLNWQNKELKLSLILERRKLDLLQELLDKLRFADNAYKQKPIKACLSAHEINNHKLNSRMVHESKSLAKEKQLIKKKQEKEEEDTSFASFWTRFEEGLHLSETTNWNQHWKQSWWLHHQIPFLMNKTAQAEDRKGDIEELECRINRSEIVLQKGDKVISTRRTNENLFVKGKAWTSLGAKRVLQEQIKLTVKEINDIRKAQLDLGRGTKCSQLKEINKDIQSLMKTVREINQRYKEANECITNLQLTKRILSEERWKKQTEAYFRRKEEETN